MTAVARSTPTARGSPSSRRAAPTCAARRRRCAPGSPTPPRTSSRRRGAENVPGAPADIDWDATLAFRRHVWSWGLGVADAMDTAQRNMGLDCGGHPRADPPQRRRGPGASAARWSSGSNTDHVDDEAIAPATR